MSGDGPAADGAALISELQEAVGADRTAISEEARELASQDVYRSGEMPLAVVSPGSTSEVQAVLAACAKHGTATFVRGGGMSYTDAYLPDRKQSIILDMSWMNAVREVNVRDLHATVEAGCTWAALDEALAKHGLRSLFWGPMSGRLATVGGAMAQGAVTFGSGRHGPSVNAALGMEVVLADGQVLVTGSGGQPRHSAFFREYGPDLTGLFCADAGALGVKTAVTLRLEPRPGAGEGLSFAFESFTDLVAAIEAVSRYGLATEVFGAEAALIRSAAGQAALTQDARKLVDILRAASGPLQALRTGLRVIVGGRRFLKASKYLVNFLAEGADAAELRRVLLRIRKAAGGRGMEVANTMAEYARAVPFPDPMIVSPAGRRLLPLHAIVPFSGAVGLHEAYEQYAESIRGECEKHGVETYVVYSTSSKAGFLWEVVIYWKDEWLSFHRHYLPDEMSGAAREGRADPQARELVERIRLELIDLMYRHGAAHLQIGRAYPYARDRDPGALELLRSIKRQVDPQGLLSPGALGI